jgi:tetratricopeptide (TPR) repeat protein
MASLHQRAKDVFLAALGRPAADRLAFLANACGDDAALRQEVESLLKFHEDGEETEPGRDSLDAKFAPGEVFAGRYRMIARIGRGGMGDVWRADDLVLQTAVALKVIRSTGPEARERILNEVRLARQITHPAVCRVFDVGEAEGGIFFTMELVRGEDLAALLRRVGRLPSEKVVDIGRQLCAGLAAAHAHGVLHRDLKPANVLIDDDGLVRITDFGIAIPRTDAGLHALTGTPAYMAPEQRAPGTPVSERTDVYALGLVLYELLVGSHAFTRPGETNQPPRPSTLVPNVNPQLERVVMQPLSPARRNRPYQETGAVTLALAMSSGAPPAAADVNPEVPAELSAVIAKALAWDPDKRFQSARELELALEASIETRMPTSWSASVQRSTLWRRGWKAAAAVGVLTALGIIAYEPLARLGSRATSTATASPIILAILPVDNPTGDQQAEYLGAGIASVISQNFGSVAGLTVLLRAETAPYQETRSDFTPIQRELGATHVLDLSLTSLTPTPQLVARLYRSGLPRAVWDETLKGDPLAIETAVLDGLGRALERDHPSRSFQTDDWRRLRKLPTTSGAALAAYSEARALLNRPRVPDADRAIELLQQATTQDPQFVIAWAALGDAFWAKYQNSTKDRALVARATEAVRRALAIDPNQAPVYYSLANLQFRTGRSEESETSLRHALQLQPDFDEALRLLGQVLESLGRIDEAEALLGQAIRISRNWNNFFVLGTIEYRAGRYERAADAFRQTTEVMPTNPSAFLMLGNSQYVLGDLQQAVGNFEHAVRLGSSAAAYANLAMAYYDSGRFEDALRSYGQALERDQRSAVNHRNIGDVYQRLGRASEARREYERSIVLANEQLAVNPRDVRSIALVALCEAKLGRRTSAERHAAEAVAVDSSSREAWQRSAEVHALLNQPEAALRDLATAVARGFEPRMARTEDELASLRKLPRFEEILRSGPGNAANNQGAR